MNRSGRRWTLAVMLIFAFMSSSGSFISADTASPPSSFGVLHRTYRTSLELRLTQNKMRLSTRRRAIRPVLGTASWYSQKDRGIRRHTANGEVFDDTRSTCAAWNIPFGTYLKVTNTGNGKSVTCRVNDRGPRKHLGRRIDLSKAAFRKIADLRLGLIKVSVMPVA